MRPRKPSRRQKFFSNQLDYCSLEDRLLLAVTATFESGTLAVNLSSAGDTANISTQDGFVIVNGSQVNHQIGGGNEMESPVLIEQVENIVVNGNDGVTGQTINFYGNFSSPPSALVGVTVNDVSTATFNSAYALSGDLNINLIGTGGMLTDEGNGRLDVAGSTDINSGANPIVLDNSANDFIGEVSLMTEGTDQSIVFSDTNNLLLKDLVSSGDATVSAEGNITDVAESFISVDGTALFDVDNLTLGDDLDDIVTFFRVGFTATGDVEVHQDNRVILIGTTAENLWVTSPSGIFDGQTTNISVNGLARFEAPSIIRLGDNGQDTFNAGTLQFQTSGSALISEDGETVLTGQNFAQAAFLTSSGNIFNTDNTTINITENLGLNGKSIELGTAAMDELMAGSFFFFGSEDVTLDADSNIHVIQQKNRAENLRLISTGAISDNTNARMNVTGNAFFDAVSVDLGDSTTDIFNAQTIEFTATGMFRLSEDSGTILVGDNTADSVVIFSDGLLTNAEDTSLVTSNFIGLFGATAIDIGHQSGDNIQSPRSVFNTPGLAKVAQDNAMTFGGANSVGTLEATSTGLVTNNDDVTISVGGQATIAGSEINIGNANGDEFNATAVNVNSTGNVAVSEDSDLALIGSNTANSLTLSSTGVIHNADSAQIAVTFLLNLSAVSANLGNSVADSLTLNTLTFNTSGNTSVTADSDIHLFGNSQAEVLNLFADNMITDAMDADTKVQSFATFSADDAVTLDACFEILSGNENYSVLNGVDNIMFGNC